MQIPFKPSLLLFYCCFDFAGKLRACICPCDYTPLCFITCPVHPVRLDLGFIGKILTCYPYLLSL